MERSAMPEYATEIATREERLEMAGPLEALMQSVGWPVYAELMKRARLSAREAFEDPETDVAFQRGVIFGLRWAESLPQTILQEALQTAQAEASRGRQVRGEVFRATGEESF